MVGIFIGLGSNVGNREKNLYQALNLIQSYCKIVNTSSIHETQPLYNPDQPLYLNQIIEVQTTLSPEELLTFLLDIEKKIGRIRTVKYAPRIIDLDLLLYQDKVINQKALILPHPLLHEREFVLAPLLEIAPNTYHPLLNKTMKELFNNVKKSENN